MDLQLIEIVPIAAFVTLVAMFMIIGTLVTRLMRDPIRDRLEALSRGEAPPPSSGFLEGLAQQLPDTGPDGTMLDTELRRAGYYRPAARMEFLALRNGLMLLMALITGFAIVLIGPDNLDNTLFVLVMGVIGIGFSWALPRLILRNQGTRRIRRITQALPFALDMITMSLSGGLSLQDALFSVSRELYTTHSDLAIELLIIRQHSELASLEMAFEQFGRRVDSPEISSMASLVTQGQKLGTDVVQSINDYADDLRLKRRQLADAKSSRASVHMLLPLTLLLMPSVMIILWGPSILELFEFVKTFEGPQGMQ